MLGSIYDDTIQAKAGADIVNAGLGNDNVAGNEGNDILLGGDGNDVISGGDGNDSIYGDGDLNLISYQVVGEDTQIGDDLLFGEAGDDVILGLAGNDYIDGGSANDTLLGGDGNDTLIGGSGNNQLQGGAGDDIIDLGIGAESSFVDSINYAFGEAGSDSFIISNKEISLKHKYDIIADFDVSDAEEKIDLTQIQSVSKYSDLNIFQQGSDAYITFNTNFFGYSQVIKLENVNASSLNSSKFILSNAAPIASDDNAVTDEDHSVTINILTNDSDDKTNISDITITPTQPANGVVVVNSDGTLRYTPNVNFNGVDQFEYQLTDSGGEISTTAKVTINISAVNDAPIVTASIGDKSFYSTKEINFQIGNIFTEVDGEILTYAATLEDGTALPQWINFDQVNFRFYRNSSC